MHFNPSSSPSECVNSVSIPAICVIAEGSKEMLLSSAISLLYDLIHSLLATIELPIVSQIVEESKAQPYLSLSLDLDPHLSVQSRLRRAISPHKGVPM
ncbi:MULTISPECIES: AraC family transcriptional regulator [unclassified Microcoleus]|uniref:AraC family transcriptional regulator n=1 Tax=unclassified Microcoleus TaxID=2642155 RepID=UPI002FD42128